MSAEGDDLPRFGRGQAARAQEQGREGQTSYQSQGQAVTESFIARVRLNHWFAERRTARHECRARFAAHVLPGTRS